MKVGDAAVCLDSGSVAPFSFRPIDPDVSGRLNRDGCPFRGVGALAYLIRSLGAPRLGISLPGKLFGPALAGTVAIVDQPGGALLALAVGPATLAN